MARTISINDLDRTQLGSFSLLSSVRIFNAALAAVDPYIALLSATRVENNYLLLADAKYDLDSFERIIVVGAGKATARMALAVEQLLGEKISTGLILVKQGHTVPLSFIEQVEAAHPVPDEAGVGGAQRLLQMLGTVDDKTLVICLLSGGASALLVAPVEGITLQDKQETTRLLLNAGASIFELNAVRKHLSRVKGGKLAQAVYPAQLLTLAVSDVIGDPPDVIASGPTSADCSTYVDAWTVIEKFSLQNKLPANVLQHLRCGMAGKEAETIKPGDRCLEKSHYKIIAGIRQALDAAYEQAVKLGFATRIMSASLQGEASEVAHYLAEIARTERSEMKLAQPRCLLFGGETTVNVRGNGLGGRNQELALAFALEIEGEQGVMLLSAGTDGSDGPTDAAGALVDGSTVSFARCLGQEPKTYLECNDSYRFFSQLDAASGKHSHFKTGVTGTNVMDIQVVLLYKPATAVPSSVMNAVKWR